MIHSTQDTRQEQIETLWYESLSTLKLSLPLYTYKQKRAHEKQLTFFFKQIINYLNHFPKDSHQQEIWRQEVQHYLKEIKLPSYLSSFQTIEPMIRNQFITQTKLFFTESRAFDSHLTLVDQFQAIRNHWIILILQCLMNEPLAETKATLAYSLLYPYTDNLLDDPTLSTKEKIAFNHRLTQRLQGKMISPILPEESNIYKLIDMIEETYPRKHYPNVYQALLLIQQGQIQSLKQQGKLMLPYEEDILNISILKGGASVLADGYLINGTLSPKNQQFTFGYGFLLQLCDDLQDIKTDLSNQHNTIFTQLATHHGLDPLANKLISFCQTFLQTSLNETSDLNQTFKPLIETNCLYLILFAIAQNRDYFSKSYLKQLSPHLPFSLFYTASIKHRLNKYIRQIKPNYHGQSTLDIILSTIKEEIN